ISWARRTRSPAESRWCPKLKGEQSPTQRASFQKLGNNFGHKMPPNTAKNRSTARKEMQEKPTT
ncbi:MAG TPA: hypothetical protein VGR93_04055, partial [Candidatus Acidoferrales bacterium]|nr:hypothetical protein [Candidatus Acidoferrales bacterium]